MWYKATERRCICNTSSEVNTVTLLKWIGYKQGRRRARQVTTGNASQITHNKTETRRNERKSKAQARRRNQQKFEQGRRVEQYVTLGASILFYLLLALFTMLGYLNKVFLGWYVLIGIITFAMYAKDKSAAQNGRWRTPESTLHILSLLGGWAGAMLAQTFLRHKSKKMPFRWIYYLTILINLIGLTYLMVGADLSFLMGAKLVNLT